PSWHPLPNRHIPTPTSASSLPHFPDTPISLILPSLPSYSHLPHFPHTSLTSLILPSPNPQVHTDNPDGLFQILAPSFAEPSRDGPRRAETSRTEPQRTLLRAEPSREWTSRTQSFRTLSPIAATATVAATAFIMLLPRAANGHVAAAPRAFSSSSAPSTWSTTLTGGPLPATESTALHRTARGTSVTLAAAFRRLAGHGLPSGAPHRIASLRTCLQAPQPLPPHRPRPPRLDARSGRLWVISRSTLSAAVPHASGGGRGVVHQSSSALHRRQRPAGKDSPMARHILPLHPGRLCPRLPLRGGGWPSAGMEGSVLIGSSVHATVCAVHRYCRTPAPERQDTCPWYCYRCF
ncbi:unnamed protein product, partial [Closterium sp. NIES-54]